MMEIEKEVEEAVEAEFEKGEMETEEEEQEEEDEEVVEDDEQFTTNSWGIRVPRTCRES